MKDGDVEGECPSCRGRVAVYVRGKKLCIRAHTYQRRLRTGGGLVESCPVAGVDGTEALTLVHKELAVTYADRDVTEAEEDLRKARERAVGARGERDAYTAQIAALRARAGV